MAVPTAITSLTNVAASNGPDGATELPSVLDDYQRAHAALLKRSLSIGASISATATLAVPDDYGYVEVMGSGEIVAIDDSKSWDGREVTLRFSAVTTLSHSTNLALPLAQQLVTEAGGFGKFIRRTTGVWECVSYERRAAGPQVFSTLDVRGQASFSGTMNVGGPISAASTLDVRAQASFSASVNVGGSLDVHGPASLSASLNVGGPLQVSGAVDVHGAASFSASVSIGGTLDVGSFLNVHAASSFSGSMALGGTLDVRGQASFSASLNAGGPILAASTLDVRGQASLSASLIAGGPLIARSTLDVRGTSSFSATLSAIKLKEGTKSVALLLLNTVTTSNGATHDVTADIDGTFDEYELHLIGLTPATDNTTLYLRVSEDGGTSFKAGVADYAWERGFFSGGAAGAANDVDDSEIELAAGLSNGATSPFSMIVRFWQPAGTAKNKTFQGDGSYGGSAANVRVTGMGHYKGTTNAINAIRLLMSSGNLTVTTYLYGLRKS